MGLCALCREAAVTECAEETDEAVVARLQACIHSFLAGEAGLQFIDDGAALQESSRKALCEVAQLLKPCPALGVKVVCYTGLSTEAFGLSQMRAQNVRDALAQAGCVNLISATGMGHVDGCTARVELVLFLPQSAEMTEATVAEAADLLRQMRAEVDHKVGARLACSGKGANRCIEWNTRAKVEAQFAYMTALLGTPGFVALAELELERCDADNSGALDWQELAASAQDLVQRHGWAPALAELAGPKLAETLYKRMDRDCDGLVSRAEFLTYLAHLHYECHFGRLEAPDAFEPVEGLRPDRSRRSSRKGRRPCC